MKTSCREFRVLDGGLGSELELRGADVSGPLWSAAVVEERPEVVAAVHRAYFEAGAECVAAASYQISRAGYRELGRTDAEADRALARAVEVACQVRDEAPERRLAAASLGPYGAVLHNGAEYHGNYEIGYEELVRFHRERIAVAAGTDADVLALETIPSLGEARAIVEALEGFPELPVWMSFVCRDGQTVVHGEPLVACAREAMQVPGLVGVGVNCTAPRFVAEAIAELKAAGVPRVMVYPNLGEGWDAVNRCWMGTADARGFGELAAGWFAGGADVVGGCCRTRPEHIREVGLALGR